MLHSHSHEHKSDAVQVYVMYFNGGAQRSFTHTSGVLTITCTET